MTRPQKAFFVSGAIFFCIDSICMAILQSWDFGRAIPYRIYILLLMCSGLIGGTLAYVFSWLLSRGEIRKSVELEQKNLELEREIHSLEETANRREEFIGSFAHELKTPLTAIIGYADMLRSKEMNPKSRFTAAGYIFSEGKRLEALSLKLMDIIVAGKQTFETRTYEAGYFIRSISAAVLPSLANDGIKLETRWEPGELSIEPDLGKTMIINLVDNARKASSKNSIVELYGRCIDGGYAIYVTDHGRGMKKEELSKITEPFYMIDKSRSRAQNGAGLGLALCQRVAELHGTALEYESEEGKGTTVRVLLKGGPISEKAD